MPPPALSASESERIAFAFSALEPEAKVETLWDLVETARLVRSFPCTCWMTGTPCGHCLAETCLRALGVSE